MKQQTVSRRAFVGGMGAGALAITVVGITPQVAFADAKMLADAVKQAIGDKTPAQGKITIDAPQIAENGSTVPLTIEVESPMSADNYVKALHLFADKNPAAEVATLRFTPANGQARASVRVRLAQTQNVVAVAEMSNGEIYQAQAAVKVTIGGCGG